MSIGSAGYYRLSYDIQYIADDDTNNQTANADGAGELPAVDAGEGADTSLPSLPRPTVRDYDCSRAIHDVDDAADSDDEIAGPDNRSETPPNLQRFDSMSSIASSLNHSDESDDSYEESVADASAATIVEPVCDDVEGPFAVLQRLNDSVGTAPAAPRAPRASRPPHRIAVDDALAVSNMSRAEAIHYLLARVENILANFPVSDSDDE